ncbi:MAG: organomercurial lyase [Acidimicrobiales bacterium]
MTDRPDTCCDADLLRADLGDAVLDLAVAGFAALWEGRSVPVHELLHDRADAAMEIIETQAAKGRLEIDEQRRLVGVHGLTLWTTPHRFEHGGRAHHTWCAFDSIGIPAALDLDATAHTDCPACHRRLAVEIRGGEPLGGDLVLWLPAAPGNHLMDEFCASADLYCSPDHLRQRIDLDRAAGTVSTLADAAALGRDVWADVANLEVGGHAV